MSVRPQRDRSRDRDRRRGERYGNNPDRPQDNCYDEKRYRSHQSRRYDRESWNERDSYYDQPRSNRNERYRSRSRERNSHGDWYDNNDYNERNDRRKEDVQPNNTIMVRNLGFDIDENEIMIALTEVGLKPKEIRLMRRKDTGESRGFAFVEFNDISEATYWRDQTQGLITFSDGQQASLHYSIPKESFNADRNQPVQQQLKTDWTCFKCGVVNFKRRDVCFKCSTTREDSAANEPDDDEISSMPTNCLLFRNLNPYTTEERILTILGTLTSLPIKSIKIPKENTASTCACYVELYTTHEAAQIYGILSTLNSGFVIDDFTISIGYAKRNSSNANNANINGMQNAATMALAAAQWTNQTDQGSSNSSLTKQTNTNVNELSSNQVTKIQTVIPLNAPVLASGINYGHVTVNNQTYRKYPIPYPSTYQLEETSGFYYDAVTCLYYDSKSHYYYNGITQKYMYWSNDHQTYIPVESEQQKKTDTEHGDIKSAKSLADTSIDEMKKEKLLNSDSSTNGKSLTQAEKQKADEEKLKNDKAKQAKKIAKDMEKWAKSMNQKTMSSKQTTLSSNVNSEDSTASSGAGNYSALGLGNTGISLNINTKEVVKPKLIEKNLLFDDIESEKTTNSESDSSINTRREVSSGLLSSKHSAAKLAPLSAQSSNDVQARQASPKEDTESIIQKLNLTDWNKLICLLCKRQFNSKEQLSKHQQASDLHKTNLFKLTGVNFTQEQIAELSQQDGEFNFSNYRDRAKERRQKYGQSDQPEVPSSRYKDKYTRGIKHAFQTDDHAPNKYEAMSAPQANLQDSIGAKLLKQMGWSDGQGLGRKNQGRSSLIEVERRAAGVGLGIKTNHPSGESYKDAVKRTMIERYKELHEKEISNRNDV